MAAPETFTVLDVVAASCAVHDHNGGFVSKNTWNLSTGIKKKSNSQILYDHFFQDPVVTVTDQDLATAAEIVEYLKGLGFKSFQRDLTDFERQVLRFVTADAIGKDRLGIAASLPNVYHSKRSSDAWAEREHELSGTSQFLGTESERLKTLAKIEYIRYIPNTCSYLVTASVDNLHILKFFLHHHQLEVGTTRIVSGIVKPHQLNKHTGHQETMLNRVRLEEPKP
jgi:hypothetical protein